MSVELTKSQGKILQFIKARLDGDEGAPTYREICTQFNFRSPKAATDHLMALERKGYITRNRKRSRGIRLVHQQSGIPLLGQIPAGFPTDTTETSSTHLAFGPELFGLRAGSKLFALTVRGDSMEGRHIFDGDIVLIDGEAVPKNRNIVAALIDNETTLKTFIKQDGKVWLQAENANYPDLIPAWDLQIQGVARAVIRMLPQ